MEDALQSRVMGLGQDLARLHSLAVAFSGGVDSSVLLHVARQVLGERVVGVIADSASLPRSELVEARAVAAGIGVRLVELSTAEMDVEGYRLNEGLRCYWCRHTLFAAMESWARANGFEALAYGEIVDDLGDDRPGRRAAAEFEVLAPLVKAGMSKRDVRAYAKAHSLPVANKPASACLASRLPLGTPVTRTALARIESAERAVRELGFQVLRVRNHGAEARLEFGSDELTRAQGMRQLLLDAVGAAGFKSIRLASYRQPGGA